LDVAGAHFSWALDSSGPKSDWAWAIGPELGVNSNCNIGPWVSKSIGPKPNFFDFDSFFLFFFFSFLSFFLSFFLCLRPSPVLVLTGQP
jgi:hypothetical protein